MIGSRNSISTDLCGKVPFPLESLRHLLHSPLWAEKNFSTGGAEVFGTNRSPQIIRSHSTWTVEKFSEKIMVTGRN